MAAGCPAQGALPFSETLDAFVERESRLAGPFLAFVRCGDLAWGTAPEPVRHGAVLALVGGHPGHVVHDGRTWRVAGALRPAPLIAGVSASAEHDDPPDALARFVALATDVAGRAIAADPLLALVASSPALAGMADTLRRIAPTSLPVLVLGETGVGKEEVARALHLAGRRAGRFVAENCAAVPETLLEAELFGVRRGAFTGATADRGGRILEADGGTLLLDEIGDLPPALQGKLLRVVQEREVRPLGGDRARPIDVRLVSATHRPIDASSESERFRRDLYYRLAGITVRIPPLRERIADLPMLTAALLARIAAEGLGPGRFIGPRGLLALSHGRFPGNVRELDNVLRRSAALSPGPAIPAALLAPETPSARWGNMEAHAIREALARARGVKADAARRLGWSRQKLYRRMETLGIG